MSRTEERARDGERMNAPDLKKDFSNNWPVPTTCSLHKTEGDKEQGLLIFQETDQVTRLWSNMQRPVTVSNAEGPRL